MQGSYVDVHDNEVVNLSIDKAMVSGADLNDDDRLDAALVDRPDAALNDRPATALTDRPDAALDDRLSHNKAAEGRRYEEQFHFIHPELDEAAAWRIHDAVKRVVKFQGIQDICHYLAQLNSEKKLLLPQSPSVAYAELVRMGMPSGEGFNEKTFHKYYRRA